MKKTILPTLWIAALLIAGAFAPVYGQELVVAVAPKAAPMQCLPSQVPTGTGTKAIMVDNEWGRCFRWWCPKPGADYDHEGFCSPWSYTLKIPDVMPSNTADAIRAIWNENVLDLTPTDPLEIQLRQDSWIQLQPTKPAAPRWAVAPNSSFPTRPVYWLEVRQTATGSQTVLNPSASGERVPVLTDGKPTPCDCLKASSGISPRYCAIPQAAGTTPVRVAVCRLQ